MQKCTKSWPVMASTVINGSMLELIKLTWNIIKAWKKIGCARKVGSH